MKYLIFYVNVCQNNVKYLVNYSWDFYGCFLYKDYVFRGFFPCPDSFLECQRFVTEYQAAPRSDEVDCKVHETRWAKHNLVNFWLFDNFTVILLYAE